MGLVSANLVFLSPPHFHQGPLQSLLIHPIPQGVTPCCEYGYVQPRYVGETPLLENSLHRFTWLNWLAEISVNKTLEFTTWSLVVASSGIIRSIATKTRCGTQTYQHAPKVLLNATVWNWCHGFAELQGHKNKRVFSVWFPRGQVENISFWKKRLDARWFHPNCFARSEPTLWEALKGQN